MTTAPPEPTDQADARREAEIRALEAAVVLAVIGRLTLALHRITGRLLSGFATRDRDRSAWLEVRQRVAGELTSLRVDLAPAIVRSLPAASRLGARHGGDPLPAGYDHTRDDLIRATLDTIDRDVRSKLSRAADEVLTARIDTTAQLDAVTARIDSARSEAAAQVGTAVTRAVANGTATAAETQGLDLVWVAERNACGSCLSMSGSVLTDGLFKPVKIYPDRPIPWMADGVASVPLHAHCRCHVRANTPGVAAGLQREAARSVAYGWSDYDSLPARLAAVDKVLRTPLLPVTVRRRAAESRSRGTFTRTTSRPGRVPAMSTRRSRDG